MRDFISFARVHLKSDRDLDRDLGAVVPVLGTGLRGVGIVRMMQA